MLSLDNLTARYPSWSVTFTTRIAAGEIVALIGRSGAGKSTLLGMLAGFVPVCAGSLSLAGQDLLPLTPAERPITTLFQDHNLFAHLSVQDNIGLGLHPGLRLTAAQQAQVQQAAARVGLGGMLERLPDQLSGGQQQRVALARALVRDRPLLLLDEPFSALDPALRREMLDEVAELARSRQTTVLMVSHNPEDAARIADRLLFIHEGHIAFDGAPDELAHPRLPALAAYLGVSQ